MNTSFTLNFLSSFRLLSGIEAHISCLCLSLINVFVSLMNEGVLDIANLMFREISCQLCILLQTISIILNQVYHVYIINAFKDRLLH